ncbi:MAG: hemerythrin domain-containing protein [Planctomycetota bacterium]
MDAAGLRQALVAEHRSIEAALGELDPLLLAHDMPPPVAAARAAFALVERHVEREEREFFPQLSGARRRLAETMEGEHLYLHGMMQRIERALGSHQIGLAHALYREFRDLLGRHMAAEDVELLEE